MVLPRTEYKKRDIWTADMIRTALEKCTDSRLYVTTNLAFACSLRVGEILGLTWDNVYIADDNIKNNLVQSKENTATNCIKQPVTVLFWHPRRESNSQLTLRRGLLYPFNYGGIYKRYPVLTQRSHPKQESTPILSRQAAVCQLTEQASMSKCTPHARL